MTLRPLLLALPLTALIVLTACVEDACEKVTARVRWSPETATVEVDLTLHHLPAEALDCTDVPTCTEAVRTRLLAGDDSFPGRLAKQGATDLTATLQATGDALDLLVHYTAPVGSEAAGRDHVYVSTAGKPHLIAVQTPGVTLLSEGARETERVTLSTDEGPEVYAVHRLPPKARELTLERLANPPKTPLFQAIPGLREALQAEGLLAATTAPAAAH